jgi:hypothetical protein
MQKNCDNPRVCAVACMPNRSIILALAAAFGLAQNLSAQTARDLAAEVTATVQESPPRIILNWNNTPLYQVATQTIYRRLKDAPTWVQIATPVYYTTTYTDSAVSAGVSYEYRVARTFNGGPVYSIGYISAGIRVPLVTDRGRVILVVDSTMSAPLSSELATFTSDLTGDGWTVIRADVSRTDTPPAIRATIQSLRNADPAHTAAVILFGHVPVPYSGDFALDDHPDHYGAWPTDAYYGDMDGTWTDSTVNDSAASDPRNRNVPGDGKFDQTILPSNIELQVGRIDLANMPKFDVNETELLRRYLNRDHSYRFQLGAYATVGQRALVDDNFGFYHGEAFAVGAWRGFTPCVGAGNVQELDWFTTLQTQSYLWAYGCGSGSYIEASGVGLSSDFATKDSRAVFNVMFGSFFGDWDYPNCILRAPLAGTASGLGLTNCWSGRPHWALHSMALGETIGYATRVTQNNDNAGGNGYDSNQGAHTNSIALLGDPTLRLYPVAPPTGFTATASGTAVALNWTASTASAIEGYLVTRAPTVAGPFKPLRSALIAGTSFVDRTVVPGASYAYLVRAVRLETSPAGSFLNPSQGVFSGAVTAPAATGAEINVSGNGQPIVVGDTTAMTANGTDFGGVETVSTATTIFTITNPGTAPLTIGSAGITGANAGDFTITASPPASVAAGGSATFAVRFAPSAIGPRTATFTLATNDADEASFAFPLAGTGLQASAAFDEYFDGPALDSGRWTTGSLFAPLTGTLDPLVTVVQQGGLLTVTPRTGVAGGRYNGVLSLAPVNFRGATLTAQVTPATGGALTWMAIGRGNNLLLMSSDGMNLYLNQTVNGLIDQTAVPYNPALQAYWRVRHEAAADALIFEASADGVVWQPLRSVARAIALDSLQIELVAGTSQASAAPTPAAFDNLRFQPNRAPVVTAPPTQSTRPGILVSLPIGASDLDSQTLTFAASGLPAGLSIDPATGVISGTIPSTAFASNNVTLSVTDGLLTATTTFLWNVTRDAMPSFADDFSSAAIDPSRWSVGVGYGAIFGPPDPLVTVNQTGGQVIVTPRGNFSNYALNGLVSKGLINLTGASMSVQVSPAGSGFTWLGLGSAGNYFFMLKMGGKLYLSQVANEFVDSASIDYLPTQHSYWRIRHEIIRDRIVFEASPDAATWSLLRALPRAIPITAMPIELTCGTTAPEPATTPAIFDNALWQLSPANLAPIITAPGAQVGTVGVQALVAVSASDPDGNALTYSASGLPPGLSIDPASGAISGTPTTVGISVVTVTATDSLLSASATFNWEVKANTGFPVSWTIASLGSPAAAGSATFANGVATLTSTGTMSVTSDQFQFASQPFVGDGETIVRVNSQTGGSSARAGIMLRESSSPNSAVVGVYLMPSGTAFQYRTATGGNNVVYVAPRFTAPNNWLRLTRSGNTFAAFYGTDGSTWTLIRSINIALPSTLNLGLAVSAQSSTVPSTATFDVVNVIPSTLPSGWIGGDIGTPVKTDLERYAGGTFSVTAGGAGFVGAVDEGHFTSQQLTGNGEIIAHVGYPSGTYGGAKAGVMMRDSIDPKSRMALLAVTQTVSIYFQTRINYGATAATTIAPRGDTWLRLVRNGNTVTAYRSANGAVWTLIGTNQVNFGPTISIGLAVTAGNASLQSTALFDSVVINPLP